MDSTEQLNSNRNMGGYGTMGLEQEASETMGLVQNESSKLPQYIAAIAATLGALASGTVLGFTSPTENEYETEDIIGSKVSKDDFKWVGALAPLGCLIMCIPVGFIMDFIGRKLTMLLMVLVFALGWGLIIGANSVGMLFAGRLFCGMAGGTFCIAAPLYTSEIAEKDIRGTLGSYFQLMVTVGILFVYVIGNFWGPQTVAIICAVVPFVFGIAFVFMPESPVYALKKGQEVKAKKSLQWLRGKYYNIDDEIKDMQDGLNEANSNPITLQESLRKRATRKALAISFGLMFFQQMSGINAVIFYTSNIFESAGSTIKSKEASIIVGAMQVIGTFASSLVIERLGRRILLLVSDAVMAICAMLLGVYFYLKNHNDAKDLESIGWLPIVSLSIFIIMFSIGYGPIPWMICAEVLPREIKIMASAAAGTFNWFLAFLVTLFYSSVSTSIGTDVTFFIFMTVSAVGVVFVFLIVPETKGKTLDEIQRELEGDNTPRSNGHVNEGFST